jgi:hypothetical protein
MHVSSKVRKFNLIQYAVYVRETVLVLLCVVGLHAYKQ